MIKIILVVATKRKKDCPYKNGFDSIIVHILFYREVTYVKHFK